MTLVFFILVFGLIVLFHEFGHYLLGRMNGIHVVEFAIGMGPKIVGFRKNDTDYVIRLLPIGGACMFEGEDGLERTEGNEVPVGDRPGEGAFNEAKVWGRFATVLAGPLFNFVLAFFLGLFLVGMGGSDRPVINGLMEGYPAQEAGIQPGDVIRRMNGERIYLAREILLNTYVNGGAPMTIEYEREGEIYTTVITPRYYPEEDRYLIGFQGYGEYVECRNLEVFRYGYYEIRYNLKATLKSLVMLLQGKAGMDDLSGPVGIAQMIGDVAKESAPHGPKVLFLNISNIALLLSVNLGVINLLPLPALDGGRLIFLLLEAVRGKPIPPDKEGMVHFAGFVALMAFMVFVLYHDIMRLMV
ncbi:MAG: RIP metalloprotease RseP [Lachnospiraceae bacterium]|nr:RIP metalloprotease RseP [Lachnospiraceae bacterium]